MSDSYGYGAAAIGALGSIASSTIAADAGSAQNQESFHYQQELNKQQQQYAQENSLLDYQRQRELSSDIYGLAKIGKRNAGMNTAQGDGSDVSAQSVNGTAAPNAGSAPAPYDVAAGARNIAGIAQGVGDLINSTMVSNADAHQKESAARNQDIKNTFEIDNQLADLENKHKAGKISDAEYDLKKEELSRMKDTHNAYVKQENEKANQEEFKTKIAEQEQKQAEIKTEIDGYIRDMNREQLKQLQIYTAQYEKRLKAELDEIKSRTNLNRQQAATEVKKRALLAAQEYSERVRGYLDEQKKPFAARMAQAMVESVEAGADKTYYESVEAGARSTYEKHKYQTIDDPLTHAATGTAMVMQVLNPFAFLLK